MGTVARTSGVCFAQWFLIWKYFPERVVVVLRGLRRLGVEKQILILPYISRVPCLAMVLSAETDRHDCGPLRISKAFSLLSTIVAPKSWFIRALGRDQYLPLARF